MGLTKLNQALRKEIEALKEEGRAKKAERVITERVPSKGTKGERYLIKGYGEKQFLRMNSNSYLGLSTHPKMIAAADAATHKLGVGPGAVRFIDGTFEYHIALEKRIAAFTDKPAAKIFNSAYTANLALGLVLSGANAFWIGDELNHNSIIRSMRIANVPRSNRAIFKHNDTTDLERCLKSVPSSMKRVCIIFDGIFSMRGDFAPIDKIHELAAKYDPLFEEGIITIVDDSHGIAAYGSTGRGTAEHTGTSPDIIIGTFGKGFGVNGGFICASEAVVETIRQKGDTYIYTNPLSVADCAAATEAINIVDSREGLYKLEHLRKRTLQFREGLQELGFESIEGPHAVVPILIRDTKRTQEMVEWLFEKGILAVGLTFPVVPKGSETIRIQINAGLTREDIAYALECLKEFS